MSSRRASREPLRVEPDRRHRLADRDAVVVAHLVEMLAPRLARDRARAPEARGAEARALLLAERDDLERAARPADLLLQRPHRRDRRDDPERAVVAAARRLRVDVRAGRDHRARLRSLEPPPDVADRVAPHLEPRRRQPLLDLGLRGRPLRRVRDAPDAGLAVGAVAREREDRVLDRCRGRSRSIDLPRVPAAGGLRQRDGEDQRAAVEELLHEGLHAEQLEPGDAGDEEVDGRDRADRVEAPGEDRRRAEERRGERGQQEARAPRSGRRSRACRRRGRRRRR